MNEKTDAGVPWVQVARSTWTCGLTSPHGSQCWLLATKGAQKTETKCLRTHARMPAWKVFKAPLIQFFLKEVTNDQSIFWCATSAKPKREQSKKDSSGRVSQQRKKFGVDSEHDTDQNPGSDTPLNMACSPTSSSIDKIEKVGSVFPTAFNLSVHPSCNKQV
eukprot:jgi/Bigna1/141948/aug1.66_g16656